MKSCRGVDLHY